MTTTSEGSTSRRRALICGVTGQDGAYLARHLIDQGYAVTGTSRDATLGNLSGLRALQLAEHVPVVWMASNDFRRVLQTVLRVEPDEIYNLAGQSSVGLSFEQPVEAIESIALGTLNLLEAIRFVGRPIRFYNAGSSECLGDTGGAPADEQTPFRPRSPYAVAKACAHHLVANYREAYRMHACTGILFNHESPLRSERFVTQEVCCAAARIVGGSQGDRDARQHRSPSRLGLGAGILAACCEAKNRETPSSPRAAAYHWLTSCSAPSRIGLATSCATGAVAAAALGHHAWRGRSQRRLGSARRASANQGG
jgi:hypothetical protein